MRGKNKIKINSEKPQKRKVTFSIQVLLFICIIILKINVQIFYSKLGNPSGKSSVFMMFFKNIFALFNFFWFSFTINKSSRPQVFYKNNALKSFLPKTHRKSSLLESSFSKLEALQPVTVLRKTPLHVFFLTLRSFSEQLFHRIRPVCTFDLNIQAIPAKVFINFFCVD